MLHHPPRRSDKGVELFRGREEKVEISFGFLDVESEDGIFGIVCAISSVESKVSLVQTGRIATSVKVQSEGEERTYGHETCKFPFASSPIIPCSRPNARL